MVLLFYTRYISVELAHNEIVRAQVGSGGIQFKIPSVVGIFKRYS